MKAYFIQEPELQFGDGRHIDIRFGIQNYRPLDHRDKLAPKAIPLGIVGTDRSISELKSWLDTCAAGIDPKVSNQPNLFPGFPGFGNDSPFQSRLVFDSRLERPLSFRNLPNSVDRQRYNSFISELADAYVQEADAASERGAAVILCAVPMEVLELLEPDELVVEELESGLDERREETRSPEQDFHDLLKARAMQRSGMKPLQIVLPMTYSDRKRRQRKKRTVVRQLQDPATRAWNFHTALYYKAGGAPWRLIREESDLTCCFIGVSFYNTLDRSNVFTSSAQVFNERGQGLIIRGAQGRLGKDDRTVRMTSDGAYKLIRDALGAYRSEHKNLPARVVIHKTSSFDNEEIDAFSCAIKEHNIDLYDLIYISRSHTRLFRAGLYPPLRGTAILVDDDSAILYTRGSVELFQTYPGMYVPRPIQVVTEDTDRSIESIAAEALALTKMNWNNTQFDNSLPVTVHAARRVGRILKYLSSDERANAMYSYYM